MKVSLITTERNEAGSIKEFLDSALSQSLKPDEIVIADAASNDGTDEIIKEYQKKHPEIKLVNAPGNRSVGRNAAIQAAKNNIIAVTDVGCRIDNNWLRNITAPFKNGAEVVSGLFVAEPKTYFEEISTLLMLDDDHEIDVDTWLPSSRSIAFTKKAWSKAGKYPEYEEFGNAKVALLCGGEDTLYDLQLREVGYKFHDGLDAVVYWRPRPTVVEFFKQYRMYSIGDGIRLVEYKHFKRLSFKHLLTFLGLISGIVFWPIALLTVLLVVYRSFVRVLAKWKKKQSLKSLLLMILLINIYDIAQVVGFWTGYYHRSKLPPHKRYRFEG